MTYIIITLFFAWAAVMVFGGFAALPKKHQQQIKNYIDKISA